MINNETPREELLQECMVMIRHISDKGGKIPAVASIMLECHCTDDFDISNENLIKIHHHLSKVVTPANPSSIRYLYLESQIKKSLPFLGSVGLVRRMMIAAFLSLITFIALSLSPDVNAETVNEGILEDSGFILLQNLLFFLSAAGLGASFSNLFQANEYIMQGSYDPKHETSYWIRFVVGIIAGLMLAVLIPFEPENGNGTILISIPLLALLGGFSSNLVYKILARLVDTVDTLIQGNKEGNAKSKISEMRASLEQQKKQKEDEISSGLLNVKSFLSAGNNKSALNIINKLLNDLNPDINDPDKD